MDERFLPQLDRALGLQSPEALLRTCLSDVLRDLDALRSEIKGGHVEDLAEVVAWIDTEITNTLDEYGDVLESDEVPSE